MKSKNGNGPKSKSMNKPRKARNQKTILKYNEFICY